MVNCVAMILAGGAGTRLGALTRNESKPAVSFGGNHRIIDYTISNCIHSGIKKAGVLTQYKPETLHSHLENSESYGLSIDCLPATNSTYEGTADAIFKNIQYLEGLEPTHVLILSGDHIYQMNYQELLTFHQQKSADVTVATLTVPKEEASRFGILRVNDDNRVLEFEEKPQQPNSQIASMGVYLFNWSYLKECLLEDTMNSSSSHDFGKDILPELVHQSKLFAFPYDQYWRDVGTIQTYWETQMDLIKGTSPFSELEHEWPLLTKSIPSAFAPISIQSIKEAKERKVAESVISPTASISEGAAVYQSVILPGASVGRNVYLHRVIVAENTHIPDHMSFASDHEIMLITPSVVHRLSKTKPVHSTASNHLLKNIK